MYFQQLHFILYNFTNQPLSTALLLYGYTYTDKPAQVLIDSTIP